jgi:hypothetical protein
MKLGFNDGFTEVTSKHKSKPPPSENVNGPDKALEVKLGEDIQAFVSNVKFEFQKFRNSPLSTSRRTYVQTQNRGPRPPDSP